MTAVYVYRIFHTRIGLRVCLTLGASVSLLQAFQEPAERQARGPAGYGRKPPVRALSAERSEPVRMSAQLASPKVLVPPVFSFRSASS